MQTALAIQEPLTLPTRSLEELLAEETPTTGGDQVTMEYAARLIQEHFLKDNIIYPAEHVLRTIQSAQPDFVNSQGYLLGADEHWAPKRIRGEYVLENHRMRLHYSPNHGSPEARVPLDARALIGMSSNAKKHDKGRLITLDPRGLHVTVYGGEYDFPFNLPFDTEPMYRAFFDPGTGTKNSYRAAAEGEHVAVYASKDHSLLRAYVPEGNGRAHILSISPEA